MGKYHYIKSCAVLQVVALIGGIGIVFADNVPTDDRTSTSTASSTEVIVQQTLKEQIEARAKELERINQELAATQKNLNETKTERQTLQKELSTLEYTTNQLRLNIQADEVSVKKLTLEVQSLTFDVQDIEALVKNKRSAIAQIFRELQKNEDASPLIVFFRSSSISEGLLETQSLNDLNQQLGIDIETLRVLHGQLSGKLEEVSGKKVQVAQHQKNLENRKIIVQDQKSERQTLLTQTKSKETLYQKQLTELQKLQQEIAEEIESLDAELRTKIDPSLLPAAHSGVLAYPVEGEPVFTQEYGSTAFAKAAYQGKWHNGLDLKAPLGTTILAAESGKVVAVGDQDVYKGCYRAGYGKFIVINHDNNLTTLYAHLSRQVVKAGDQVMRGQVIGYAGKTGYATGPHLHFTVFAQPTFYMGPSRVCGQMPFGGDLNPKRYL